MADYVKGKLEHVQALNDNLTRENQALRSRVEHLEKEAINACSLAFNSLLVLAVGECLSQMEDVLRNGRENDRRVRDGDGDVGHLA